MTRIGQNIATNPAAPFISGDTRVIECSVEQSAGVPFNLTNAAIKWQVFNQQGGGFGQVVLTKQVGSGITITNAASGIFQIALNSPDTTNLSGSYYHEAEVTMPGNVVHTVFTGSLTITPGAITPP